MTPPSPVHSPSPPHTPPVPLLRPAQGNWDKAYPLARPSHSLPRHSDSPSTTPAPTPASSRHKDITPAPRGPTYDYPYPSPHHHPPPPLPASASAPSTTTSPSNPPISTSSSPFFPPRSSQPPQSSSSSSSYRFSEPNPYPRISHHATQWPHEETVVLLMEDLRYGVSEPDYQLAEVSVQLRPGDDGSSWADGEEVIKTLQNTPSRLEGAAKVFARRGKYRQCFVRFSDDGVIECQPSSLMVSRDRTIELIIEPNPEGRPAPPARYDYMHYPPPPPHVQHPHQHTPHGSHSQNPYPSPHYFPAATHHQHQQQQQQQHPQQQQQPSNSNPNPNYPNGKRPSDAEEHPAAKRTRTLSSTAPSPWRSSAGRAPNPAPASTSSRPGTSPIAGVNFPGSVVNTRTSSPESLAPSPAPLPVLVPAATASAKAPKEVVNAAIVAYLRAHIQHEDGYVEFAASKGRLLPIPDLLKGYRFATRIVNAWANRKTPPEVEGCPNKRITKNHVLQALFRQTSWGSDCEQTLQLAERYGPGGPREDARVVDVLNGGTMLPGVNPPAPGAGAGAGASGGTGVGAGGLQQGRSQGSVALLDFLKDVDREWRAREEEEARRAISGAGATGSGASAASAVGAGAGTVASASAGGAGGGASGGASASSGAGAGIGAGGANARGRSSSIGAGAGGSGSVARTSAEDA